MSDTLPFFIVMIALFLAYSYAYLRMMKMNTALDDLKTNYDVLRHRYDGAQFVIREYEKAAIADRVTNQQVDYRETPLPRASIAHNEMYYEELELTKRTSRLAEAARDIDADVPSVNHSLPSNLDFLFGEDK